jgi:photosystem II CP47 chlorophyll apoprotein
VVTSLNGWTLGAERLVNPYWNFEAVSGSHILLSGFCLLASCWHWAYWDLDLFLSSGASRQLVIDLSAVFGIHLFLSACLCFG